MNWNKSCSIDAKQVEDELKSKFPKLLHENETIELAFRDQGGKGRDSEYFTSHRILIEDGKGVGRKRKNYLSIPYSDIVCFSVQSKGGNFLDTDSELYIYTKTHSYVKIDFLASSVNIFEVYQFFNSKISWTHMRGTADHIDSTPPNMDLKESKAGKFMDWLGDNAKQIDAKEVETKLKTEYPVLLADEKVELAFKSGRDTTLFTDKRMMVIDVKGWSGKKIDFLTLLYDAINGFKVQTAGAGWDRDTEIVIHTNLIGHYHTFEQDFRKQKANLWAIQKHLCNHVLGEDKEKLDNIDSTTNGGFATDGIFGLLQALGNNQSPLDANFVDASLRDNPPILQSSEHVEMAFQGYRDITVFTTKRLLKIDKKGLFGKKVEYFSVPWEKFVAFGICTAGAIIDFDTEIKLYTEMGFYPGQAGHPGGENTPPRPPIPPRPEESCLELDFNKNAVNIFVLKYYLSRRLMDIKKEDRGAPIDLKAVTFNVPSPTGFQKLFEWLGDDQREIDPAELDTELHTNTQILLDDEKCIMAFKAGRDVSLFTNLRVMRIDVQGLTGQKVEYTSIPFRHIRAWSVESAGKWDSDSELSLYTRNRWHLAKVKLDFRKGKTDIMQVQQMISAFVVGKADDPKMIFRPKDYGEHEKKKISIKDMVTVRSNEIDPEELRAKLHFDIPILLEKERILRAFKQARDMFIFTDRRYIIIDTQGMSGQKVKYKSVPYADVGVFEFETAGHLDKDAEIYLYTDISKICSFGPPRSVELLSSKQSIAIKTTDIYEMGNLAMEYTIMKEKAPNVVIPEIECEWY